MGFDLDRLDAWSDAVSKKDEGGPSQSVTGDTSTPDVNTQDENTDEPGAPEPGQS